MILSEMSQHMALYGRFLLLPILALGLLWSFYAQGRFRRLYEHVLGGTVDQKDVETALAIVFGTLISIFGAYNSWQLAASMYGF